MPTIKIQCKACGGTGLYQGMGERDGAAVICRTCGGNGCSDFSYEEFTHRKVARDGMIARVYLSGMGYVISAKDGEAAEGKVIHFSKYGCSYEEWLSGKVPTHIEELYCPQIAYNNGIGNEPCSRCRGTPGGRISDCQFYYDKATCWEEIRIND